MPPDLDRTFSGYVTYPPVIESAAIVRAFGAGGVPVIAPTDLATGMRTGMASRRHDVTASGHKPSVINDTANEARPAFARAKQRMLLIQNVRHAGKDTMVQHLKDGIERRPGVLGGEPVIAGSRVSVAHVVARLQFCQTPERTGASFQGITVEGVRAALVYYHEHREEIDHMLAEDEHADDVTQE